MCLLGNVRHPLDEQLGLPPCRSGIPAEIIHPLVHLALQAREEMVFLSRSDGREHDCPGGTLHRLSVGFLERAGVLLPEVPEEFPSIALGTLVVRAAVATGAGCQNSEEFPHPLVIRERHLDRQVAEAADGFHGMSPMARILASTSRSVSMAIDLGRPSRCV